MASFLAGHRLPASHLNALTSVSVGLSTGGTFGTTETVIPTTTSAPLVIAAAPIDRLVVVTINVHLLSASGAMVTLAARVGDVNGTPRARIRQQTAGAGQTLDASGEEFLLAAGATVNLVPTLQVNAGTATVSAFQGTGFVRADMMAAP